MKKLIAFILLILPLLFLLLFKSGSDSIFCLEGVTKACIVTSEDVEGENVVNTLGYNYVTFDANNLKKAKSIDEDGVMLYVENSSIEKVSKSLNMLDFRRENVMGKEVVYGYTPKYQKSLILDNKKVNVQIVVDDDKLILGFPIILGGF